MAEVLYDYQVIVTNSLLIPEEVWRFYNQRACCENFIKEGIYGFGLDKILSHHYAGNYAYFELLMLGYNLMNFFKEGRSVFSTCGFQGWSPIFSKVFFENLSSIQHCPVRKLH